MRWGAALVGASWLVLGHGPAAAQIRRCTNVGEHLLLHSVNQQLFSLICSTSVGFTTLDPFCDLLSSRPEPQILAREILAGGEGASLALTELTGLPGPSPFVTLVADPSDPTSDGSEGSVSLVLSDQQEALLGCGPFYETSCELDGIDLLNAEASALLQSIDPSGAPACLREVDGDRVILPGCRGPGDDAYDPTIDGTPPAQPHPVDGSAFATEMAALSWNFLVVLVASSGADSGDPDVPDGSSFDPGDPYAPDQCSFANPELCSSVKSFTGVQGQPRVVRVRGWRIGREVFTFDVRHDGIDPSGDPATLGASLVVSSLDPAGGSATTIDLDPSRWKTLRRHGEVVGYRYRDRTRSRGGVSKVLIRNGRVAIRARGPAWPQEADGPGAVWVDLSVGGESWCGVFNVGGSARAGATSPVSSAR